MNFIILGVEFLIVLRFEFDDFILDKLEFSVKLIGLFLLEILNLLIKLLNH